MIKGCEVPVTGRDKGKRQMRFGTDERRTTSIRIHGNNSIAYHFTSSPRANKHGRVTQQGMPPGPLPSPPASEGYRQQQCGCCYRQQQQFVGASLVVDGAAGAQSLGSWTPFAVVTWPLSG